MILDTQISMSVTARTKSGWNVFIGDEHDHCSVTLDNLDNKRIVFWTTEEGIRYRRYKNGKLQEKVYKIKL